MPSTKLTRIGYPVFHSNSKYVEFDDPFNYGDILDDLYQPKTKDDTKMKRINIDCFDEIFSTLKKAEESSQVRFFERRFPNSAGSQFRLTGSDRGILPNAKPTRTVRLAAFILATLESEFQGIRVKDHLNDVMPVLNGSSITTAQSWDKGEALMETLLERAKIALERLSDPTRVYTNDPKTYTELEELIKATVDFATWKSAENHTPMAWLLFHLGCYTRTISGFFEALGSETQMRNTKRVQLPRLLTAQTAKTTLMELYKGIVCEEVSTAVAKATFSLTSADIFTLAGGQSVLNFNFYQKLLVCQFDAFTKIINTRINDIAKFQRGMNLMPQYLQQLLCLKSLKGEDFEFTTTTLIRLFLDFGVTPQVFPAVLTELEVSVKVLEERTRLAREKVLELINAYYCQPKFGDLYNCCVDRAFSSGSEKIFRLELTSKTRRVTKVATFHVDVERKHLVSYDDKDIIFNTIRQNSTKKRLTFTNALGRPGTKSVKSKYGVNVRGNFDELREFIKENSSLLQITCDQIGQTVTVARFVEAFTIMPPSLGAHCVSFGNEVLRREVQGKTFRAVKLDPETADPIDILMAFRSNEVLNISDEQLEKLYLNKIEQLTGENKPLSDITYSKGCVFRRTTPSLASFYMIASGLDKAFATELTIVSLPQLVTMKDLQANILPCYAQIAPEIEYKFTIPEAYVTPLCRDLLALKGGVKGPSNRYGHPTFEITQNELEKMKDDTAANVLMGTTVSVLIRIATADDLIIGDRPLTRKKDGSYLIGLRYDDALLNNYVRIRPTAIFGADGVLTKDQVFRNVDFISPEATIAENLYTYFTILLMNKFILSSEIFDASIKDIVDGKVVNSELEAVCSYFRDYFDTNASVANDFGGMNGLKLAEMLDLAAKEKKPDVLKKFGMEGFTEAQIDEKVLSLITPVVLTKLIHFKLEKPRLITKSFDGLAGQIIADEVRFLPEPKIVDGVRIANIESYLTPEVATFIGWAFVSYMNEVYTRDHSFDPTKMSKITK